MTIQEHELQIAQLEKQLERSKQLGNRENCAATCRHMARLYEALAWLELQPEK